MVAEGGAGPLYLVHQRDKVLHPLLLSVLDGPDPDPAAAMASGGGRDPPGSGDRAPPAKPSSSSERERGSRFLSLKV